MLARRLLYFTLLILICFAVWPPAPPAAADDIPANCETVPERASIFARYEAHNRRLMLVDWNTGADVMVVATDLPDAYVQAWSVDCRYLAVAVATGGDTYETVVYDTQTPARVGSVPDARNQPHALTWGPYNYLMVETRSGALLWNVPANTQTVVTTAFDGYIGRNFSRVRWDAEHRQVIVNLMTGGREVYDLDSGQKVPEAENTIQTRRARPSKGQILLGGKYYDCADFGQWQGISPQSITLEYESGTLRADLLDGTSHGTETLEILERGIESPWLQVRGWSASCRYLVYSVRGESRNSSDTVILDVVEKRRVDVIADTSRESHYIELSTKDDAILIQTQQNTYLWYLPNNTRADLSADVASKKIYHTEWVEGGLLIPPPGDVYLWSRDIAPDTPWTRYDILTGARSEVRHDEVVSIVRYYYYPYIIWRTSMPVIDQMPITPNPMEGETGFTTDSRSVYDDGRYEFTPPSNLECNGQRLQYHYDARQVQILDANTNDLLRVLAHDVNRTDILAWSPDCQQVWGWVKLVSNENVGYDNAPLDDSIYGRDSYRQVVWDAASGTVLVDLLQPAASAYYRLDYSPSRQHALIRTSNGFFIQDFAAGRSYPFTFREVYGDYPPIDFPYYYHLPYWDYTRGLLLVASEHYISAFDISTGVERYRFTKPWSRLASWYPFVTKFSVRNNKTVFFHSEYDFSVWDLDTGQGFRLDTGRDAAYGGGRLTISPDGRYVVMARMTARVWDLWNLPDENRLPTAIYNLYHNAKSIRFLDNVTLEILTMGGITLNLNVETGALTEVVPE